MSASVEVHIELSGETRRVGVCRYLSKRSGRGPLQH